MQRHSTKRAARIVFCLVYCLLLLPSQALAGQIIVIDGNVGDNIYGNGPGANGALPSGDYNDLLPPKDNEVIVISGGSAGKDVVGGYAGPSGSVAATGNSVTVSGGSVAGIVGGGSAQSDSGSAAATGNSVTVSGGSACDDVVGGYADSYGDATATGNTVTISGGSVGGNIAGGYARSKSGAAAATHNVVTIIGNPVFGANTTTLYGGIGTGDTFTGNTLNLHSSVTVAGLQNFQYLNFCLPSDIINNAVMLTSITAPDLTDVIIDLKFHTTAPTLAVGSTVTLIDGAGGAFAPKNIALSGYTYVLSESDGKLVATVTEKTERTRGGGCNGGVGMAWMLALLAVYGGVEHEKARRRF